MSILHDYVSVAIIGAGNFAQQQHIPNVARIPECRLHAICDVRLAVAEEMTRCYNAAYATADYRQILDDSAVDAVVIAVRDDMQAEIAIAALQAGKHVYVEKPLASSPEACDRVVRAQQESGCRLAVGFNRRYAPIYRAARSLLAADGGPYNVHISMTDDAWRWAKGYPPGYLLTLDMGHLFDLLRWFTGGEITDICCVSARPDDDCLLIRMSTTCTATINFSGHGTMDMPKERMHAISTRGGVCAEDFVELQSYGYPGQEPVLTFPGHTHPAGEFGHKYLYEKLGAPALRAVRRVAWELREEIARDADAGKPDASEARRYVEQMIPNFTRDQGWLTAVRAFVIGIATDTPTEHATAVDALAASLATQAALQSRAAGDMTAVPTHKIVS
ncbi:MAG: Gfo/Idh/MocA family oxidoreductase [bacterium]